MTSWQERVERSRAHVDPRWDAARSELALAALVRKKRRRACVQALALATAAITAVAWAVWPASDAPSPQTATVQESKPAPDATDERLVHFADGSTVALLSPHARVDIVKQEPDAIELAIASGRYRFDVNERSSREFVIASGGVSVAVLGTRCVIEHGEKEMRVLAERGALRIDAHGTRIELSEGQHSLISLLPPEKAGAGARSGAEKSRRWRNLAARGVYDEAFQVLSKKSTPKVRDRTDELLLAADVARLSGHPRSAVPYLEQILKRHRTDPRASLAAFTLGRVWLKELGQPRQAALAFADARALNLTGSLAEDALAREVEAWHQAGETQRAQERASEYVRLYPEGRRAAHVRRMGGLD